MATKKKDTYADYTATDLLAFWRLAFFEEYKQEYTGGGFIGHDLSALKAALEKHDVYEILRAIRVGIGAGEKSLKYFIQKIARYVPKTDQPRLTFLIAEYAKPEQKKLWADFKFLETKWFPDAQDFQRKEDIVEKLNNWVSRVARAGARV